MRKILVTGGAGFIGSHLCEALLEKGEEVIALDCIDPFLYPAETKRKNLQPLLKHERFHLIIEDEPLNWTPASPYGISKLSGELFCQNYHHLYGMDIFCLRFFSVYGPRQRPDMAIHKFAQRILQNQPISVYGDGSSLRDYTYVEDIVQGILCSINLVKGFEIINLGRSIPVKLLDLIRSLEEALGKKARFEFMETPPGEMDVTYADTSKALRILNYQPPGGTGRRSKGLCRMA